MAKGKLVLVSITTPVEGMKVILYGKIYTVYRILSPNQIELIPKEPLYKLSKGPLYKTDCEWIQEIAIEYEEKILPLHPDDYETALPLIGKEVEFKSYSLNIDEIREKKKGFLNSQNIYAKLILSTPVIYTEEDVSTLLEKYREFIIRYGRADRNSYQDWWSENKKK